MKASSLSWLLDVADVVPDVVPRPRLHHAEPPPSRRRPGHGRVAAGRHQLVDGLAGEQEDGAGMVRVVNAVHATGQRRRLVAERREQLREAVSRRAASITTDLRGIIDPNLHTDKYNVVCGMLQLRKLCLGL